VEGAHDFLEKGFARISLLVEAQRGRVSFLANLFDEFIASMSRTVVYLGDVFSIRMWDELEAVRLGEPIKPMGGAKGRVLLVKS